MATMDTPGVGMGVIMATMGTPGMGMTVIMGVRFHASQACVCVCVCVCNTLTREHRVIHGHTFTHIHSHIQYTHVRAGALLRHMHKQCSTSTGVHCSDLVSANHASERRRILQLNNCHVQGREAW